MNQEQTALYSLQSNDHPIVWPFLTVTQKRTCNSLTIMLLLFPCNTTWAWDIKSSGTYEAGTTGLELGWPPAAEPIMTRVEPEPPRKEVPLDLIIRARVRVIWRVVFELPPPAPLSCPPLPPPLPPPPPLFLLLKTKSVVNHNSVTQGLGKTSVKLMDEAKYVHSAHQIHLVTVTQCKVIGKTWAGALNFLV